MNEQGIFQAITNKSSIDSIGMENFHPLCWTPSHVDALNLAHCCTKFMHDCAKLGAQEIVPTWLGQP